MGTIFLNAFFAGIAGLWLLWAILTIGFEITAFALALRAQKNLFVSFFGAAREVADDFRAEKTNEDALGSAISQTLKVGSKTVANMVPAFIAGALGFISGVLLLVSVIYHITH